MVCARLLAQEVRSGARGGQAPSKPRFELLRASLLDLAKLSVIDRFGGQTKFCSQVFYVAHSHGAKGQIVSNFSVTLVLL